jgi:hypothetical protein
MKTVAFLLLALAQMTQVAAHAAPTCGELNRQYASAYRSDFKIAWKERTFICPSYIGSFARGIYDLAHAPQGDWFYKMTVKAVSKTTFSRTCDPGIGLTMSRDGHLTLCELYFDSDQLFRSGGLFHESAHTRAEDPNHVFCAHGTMKGKFTCDERLEKTMHEGSGYNYQLRFLAYVAQRPAALDLEKAVVRAAMEEMVYNRFNTVPAGRAKEWLP